MVSIGGFDPRRVDCNCDYPISVPTVTNIGIFRDKVRIDPDLCGNEGTTSGLNSSLTYLQVVLLLRRYRPFPLTLVKKSIYVNTNVRLLIKIESFVLAFYG